MEEKNAALNAGMAADDLRIHKEWKDSLRNDPNGMGDPVKFKALMDRVMPKINKEVARYTKNTQIPEEALRSVAMNWAVRGLKQFDPEQYPGANLVGYMSNFLKKLRGFTIRHQNMARIVERDARLIGDMDRVTATLRDTLGHDPDDKQIADYMNTQAGRPVLDNKPVDWTPDYVRHLRKVQVKDLVSSGFEASPSVRDLSKEAEETFVHMLRTELDEDHQGVLDRMYGLNGQPRLEKNKDIAADLGITEATASRRVAKIMNLWKRYRP